MKKILFMKFIIGMVSVFMMQAIGASKAQLISFHAKDATIETAFREIHRQTGYYVICKSEIIQQSPRVTLSVSKVPLPAFLDVLLRDKGLAYAIRGNNIIITRPARRVGSQADADRRLGQLAFSGVVRDEGGAGIADATITLSGSTRSTTTDSEGQFSISASPGDTLYVSHLAYRPASTVLKEGRRVSIVLVRHQSELQEVVVVGYGTQRRDDLTGSVSSIDASQLAAAPMGQVANSLQGLATGLEIVANGGSPVAEPVIQIRGTGSINASNPLVVIDGVPSGNLSDINPEDIAQIEVLKDASSAAIYGTRAANGVVLVTTKRGKLDQSARYQLNLYTGLTAVNNKLDLLDAGDLVTLKRERYENDGIAVNAFWEDPYYQTTRSDWQDELFRTGRIQNVDLSMSNGGEKSAYRTSLGYYHEDGIMVSSTFRRLSARINSNHVLSERLSLTQNLQYSYKNWFDPNTSSVYSGVLWQALRFNPAIPVGNDVDGWGSASANNELGDINNPIYELSTEDHSKDNHGILASIALKYEILPSLSFRGNVGYDGNIYRSRDFLPSVTQQMRRRNDAALNITNERRHTVLGETYLEFRHDAKDHRLAAVAGVSTQVRNGEIQYASMLSFADETPGQIVFDNGGSMNAITGNYHVPQKLASVFGRINYSLKDKYLATLTMRGDGSSKFAAGRRWGYFPGVSVGWRISDEPFMARQRLFDDLKLKGGWGMLGNQEVADLQYLTMIKRNIDYGNKYTFGTEKVGGARITSLANPFITWEKTAMTNIGLDASLSNGALTASVTWFNKRTTDMLIPTVAMGAIGRATIPDYNIGEMENRGWEIELNHRRRSENFSYDIGLNLTLLSNKVARLYGDNNYIASIFYGRQSQEISRTYEGMPLASYFGWKTAGLYQDQAEIDGDPFITNDERRGDIKPGDVRFVDINGDGKINELDRTYLGDPNPAAIVGLQLGARYKRFSVAANFTGNFGSELYNADRMQGLDPTYPYNMYEEALGRWHGEGTSNTIPRMSTQRANLNHRTSDLFIEKGDFVKLKTFTVAYDIKPGNQRYFSNLSVYLMAENLLTITGYSGYNPEIGYSDGNLQRGVDYANYPFSRKFNLGVKFEF